MTVKEEKFTALNHCCMNNQFDAICFGEILWDVLPTGAKPGGAPMNVAYHLQKLGLQTALVSRVGQDEQGRGLLHLLEQSQVNTRWVQTDADHPTGVVNATVHPNNEVSYEIVHPVAWDFIAPEEGLEQLVSGARFFIYGSLASRDHTTASTLEQLLAKAQTNVLDINLRPPHFSKERVEKLLQSADILKLNEHELPLITAWYSQLKNSDDQVRLLQDRFSVATIVVTRGGEGALVCQNGTLVSHPGYPVKVADTVGSGDAFLAAFLAKTKAGASLEERLQFANSLGAFIASKEGACPAYELQELSAIRGDAVSP